MSGRLIITGKKSFCPWAPKNVERVLRDERIQREKLERETIAQKAWEAEHRIQKLKRNHDPTAPLESTEVNTEKKLKRFNLFEQEEMNVSQLVNITQSQASKVGIMPEFLGGDEIERRKSGQDFYVRKTDVTLEKDDRLKSLMDPMREFLNHDGEFIDARDSRKKISSSRSNRQNISVDAKLSKKKKQSQDHSDGVGIITSNKDQSSSDLNSLEHLKRRMLNRERIDMKRENDIYSRKKNRS